ncbi:peptidoglycan DD-metalloendopeptidase family protein [Methylomonas sp. UP202]|uniref:peptidoglycan DD-metalloendopeptidase family protein n=1 Tax=Methylomonas sp. UP202 TaxID=3040943 RepID=UPI002478750F|nr:peptidoglycan DD-metalloendopeptidase family protein [Methylomonas sp. UP202]WGS86314.1 peptidoglycan DD-metalloendopeptidase family protein [Methylomonas sp. UP202]
MSARGGLAMVLVLICGGADAKKLYKYRDPQGLWHYSDQAPQDAGPIEIRQMKPAAAQRVWLEKSGDDRRATFAVRNTYPGPIEVEIDWRDGENVEAQPALPSRFVVGPGLSAPLFAVDAVPGAGRWHYGLQYRYVLGQPLAEAPGDPDYRPPLALGSRFQITQGFGGEYSHTDDQNRYAVDIMMPVDTPVHAARAGVVLDVENDFDGNGTEPAYAGKANTIRIGHDDGTMAVYAHLALEKALVKVGERVAAGQLIGFSGNTGLTTGPHLHFAVQVNRGMALVSVPFRFVDAQGRRFTPELGRWLGDQPSPAGVAAESP